MKYRTELETQANRNGFDAMSKLLDNAATGSVGNATVEGMLLAFVASHRTTQQNCVRNIAAMLTSWRLKHTKAEAVDARNEDAWEFASQIANATPFFAHI